MSNVTQSRLLLLTGPSCSGKSYLATKLAEAGYPVLDNDFEIMKRIFDLLPGEAHHCLHEHIGEEMKWNHVRRYVDFDRLVRLHHRDWFVRNSCPRIFVAVGWMYSRQSHREQVVKAFQRLPSHSVQVQIARLCPSREAFVHRYLQRHDVTKEVEWQRISRHGDSAREDHARATFQHYFDKEWQAPTDGTPWGDAQDLEGVLRLLE